MIDARMADHGGIGTYLQGLTPAIVATNAVGHACVLGAPDGAFTADSTIPCQRPFPAPIYSIREQLSIPANTHGATLWHSPHFNIPLGWQGPLVVTIHDLIHVKFPRYARSPLAYPYAAFMLRQVARRAGVVIAVSETTRRDFCAWTGMDPSRVHVIFHGVNPGIGHPVTQDILTKTLQRHGVRQPFVLWVSAIRPHKNPLVALRAFARLRAQHRIPHQLVMVGPTYHWYQEPLSEARRLHLGEVVRWLGSVARGELPTFYRAASALLMPSHYEGFGLPVLEAMASGLPVIVSSTPALSELVDNAGVTVHQEDVDGFAHHLYNVLSHEDVHRTLQERGRLRAQQFTWARSATQHVQAYRTLLGDSA